MEGFVFCTPDQSLFHVPAVSSSPQCHPKAQCVRWSSLALSMVNTTVHEAYACACGWSEQLLDGNTDGLQEESCQESVLSYLYVAALLFLAAISWVCCAWTTSRILEVRRNGHFSLDSASSTLVLCCVTLFVVGVERLTRAVWVLTWSSYDAIVVLHIFCLGLSAFFGFLLHILFAVTLRHVMICASNFRLSTSTSRTNMTLNRGISRSSNCSRRPSAASPAGLTDGWRQGVQFGIIFGIIGSLIVLSISLANSKATGNALSALLGVVLIAFHLQLLRHFNRAIELMHRMGKQSLMLDTVSRVRQAVRELLCETLLFVVFSIAISLSDYVGSEQASKTGKRLPALFGVFQFSSFLLSLVSLSRYLVGVLGRRVTKIKAPIRVRDASKIASAVFVTPNDSGLPSVPTSVFPTAPGPAKFDSCV